MFGRRKIAALVAEFVGTGVLTLLILSVQRSTIGIPFFVAIAAGLTVAFITFIYGADGYFNPAVTIALWTARKLSTAKAILYVVMQLLGAWGAYWIYTYFANSKLTPIGGHFTGRILVAEAIGAFILGIGVAATVYRNFTTGVKASVTGLSYTLAVVAASAASIGLVNPAVALGVRAWVWLTYVLGPIIGAVIGFNLYAILFPSDSDEATKLVPVAASVETVASNEGVLTTKTTVTKVAARKPRAKAATAGRSKSTSKSTTARKSSSTARRRRAS